MSAALRRSRVLPAVLALALLAPAGAIAAPPQAAQREIDGLIAALGRSGCQFQRNGTWYPAAEAQAHLRRKYEYLRKRDLVGSAEQFIERAGTRSSISGKAYAVRCPGQAALPSSQWLGARLSEIRHAAP
ncbi:MAG TPA: DUF5329 domain-containing protein [Lysobacter sp.]